MLDFIMLAAFGALSGLALGRLWGRDKALCPQRGDVHTFNGATYYVAGVRDDFVLVSRNGAMPTTMSKLAWYHLVRA